MRKRLIVCLSCLLVLILCASVFVACSPKFDEDTLQTVIEQIEWDYMLGVTDTPEDYDLPNRWETIDVNGKDADVYIKWTIQDTNLVKAIERNGVTTIDVPATFVEINYRLRATLVNSKGNEYLNGAGQPYTAIVSRKVPAGNVSGGTTPGGTTPPGTGGTTPPGSSTTSGYFTKVTSLSQIVSGAKYLIVYENGNVALDGSLTEDKAFNTQSVTITSNGIATTSALEACAFTITSVSGGYAIKSASGLYIGNNNADKNQIIYDAGQQVNVISFTGSDVNIKCGGYLRFNTTENQMRFRYFKESTYTNQQAIQLYILV